MTERDDTEPTEDEVKPKPRRSFLRRLVRFLIRLTIWVVGFFVFVFGGAWLWFESTSSDEVLATKAEAILEEGLQRDVSIGDLSLRPGLPAKLVVKDIRLANAPGTEREDQVTLERIELKLSLRALLRGRVRVGTVVLFKPVFVLEIMPDGDRIRTNLPKWNRTSEEPIGDQADLDVDSIVVQDGRFELIDHVHDVSVDARAIEATFDPDLRVLKNPRASGRVEIASVRLRVAKVEFPPGRVESHVRLEERVLWIENGSFDGEAMRLTAAGPVRANRLDLTGTMNAELSKLRESLGLDQALEGAVEARGEVSGPFEDVQVSGTFNAPDVLFDVYAVREVSGRFARIENGFEVVAEDGKFAGGSVSARYVVHGGEVEPANILEISHRGVSLERALATWNLNDAGTLARGTGTLRLAWTDGSPADGLSGSAVLTPDPEAVTRAPFAMPLAGNVRYRLAGGQLLFETLEFETSTTAVDLEGSIGLDDSTLDLGADIESASFSDVDKLWLNLAHAFGQKDWELLQIAGRGDIRARVTGAMDQPVVGLRVNADGFRYANLHLERADGRVVFDGVRQELFFDDVRFENGQGEIVMRDRIGLTGDEISLAIEVELADWEVGSILEFLDLDFPVSGLASGKVAVTGAPSSGRATFSPLDIEDDTSTIKLSGNVGWTSEEKGLSFDLDVGLQDVPVEVVAGVLDLGSDLPLSGDTTGTVHLEGPLTDVAGAGSVIIHRGTILGEPVDLIASDLVLADGVFRLKNLDIKMPAGFIKGEAKLDFAQDRFGYVIDSSEIDIAALRGYPKVKEALTGILIVSSSGGGTLADPEIVLDLRVRDAVLLEVPLEDPGVNFYFALRNGEFTTRGKVGETLSLSGSGTFDASSGEIGGNVSMSIANIAKITKQFEKRTGVTTRGRMELAVEISGSISPLAALVIDGRINTIDLKLAEHSVRTAQPSRFSLRDSTIDIASFNLLVDDQTFTAGGTISLDDGSLELEADGLIEAGLLGVVMPDLRASGDIGIALNIGGTLDDPQVEGIAEVRDADFRIQGLPQALRSVKSTLVLSEGLIEIDSFTARLGGGDVSAGGRIEIVEGTPSRIRVNARGRNVDLRLSQGLSIEGGFDLVLAGNPSERMLLQGDAALTKVLYTKDLDLGTAIVDFIVSRRARVEAVGQEWESRVGLEIKVDAANAIRVRNNLARITGSADLRLSGTLAQPVLLGRALIDEGGVVRLNNVDYRVVNGSVNFQNPFRIDPYIDLTAEGRFRNEYDVTIVVTGTPDALQTSVASDPPIVDLSILNVFGIQSTGGAGTINTRDAVTSAGGSLIDTSVGNIVGSKLGFADNLRLEGLTGSDPKVTIEKSISDEVRAVVTYTMNDAGDNVEVIEWRVSPRFLIQATRDSTKDNTYFINAVDVSFSRRFGGHW